ncbi:hypothetical protein CLRAG_03440 [Clostridium ragsdalei P11]|uniref:Uncharacterized protein n=1 Tax=Clostridium ragsdalei P11 TaxID=1353534 RepID=A0A1A6B3I0_9CLOT|nr:hypothetical protein [Clostridium ragsdalei]OBR96835.1 hypothetical protein CLRAG_03440 [Clostridium ragsdalei P11]
MNLNYSLCQNIDVATTNLWQLRNDTCRIRWNDIVIAQDYFCWLNNAIFADYSTITFLLKSMPDINQFDLRPIYCIMRSSLEKYADILNLYIKGKPYYAYMNYLNCYSASRTFKANGEIDIATNKSKEADEYKNIVKQTFNTDTCNRTTRYYLLGEFNKLPQLDNIPFVLEFNRNIANLDSRLSQILHNNVESNISSNFKKTNEIIKSIHYMMYISLCLFQIHYNWYTLQINQGLQYLKNAINIINDNQAIQNL